MIDAVEIIIIRRFFYAVFLSILIFLIISIILIFWIFLTVFWLTICIYDFKFVIACLIVIIKTTETIDDLIELKFEKIVNLYISWFDDFIWNDLIELIICDFLKFCVVFVVSNLMINLNWFLMIIFNLICIVNNLIFVSIFTIFMFSLKNWLIWLTINNMWKFSIITYAFNIAVLVFCNLMLIFCLFKLNVNSKKNWYWKFFSIRKTLTLNRFNSKIFSEELISLNQLKTVKIIKFDHELIVLSKLFYLFLFHTTRK